MKPDNKKRIAFGSTKLHIATKFAIFFADLKPFVFLLRVLNPESKTLSRTKVLGTEFFGVIAPNVIFVIFEVGWCHSKKMSVKISSKL